MIKKLYLKFFNDVKILQEQQKTESPIHIVSTLSGYSAGKLFVKVGLRLPFEEFPVHQLIHYVIFQVAADGNMMLANTDIIAFNAIDL